MRNMWAAVFFTLLIVSASFAAVPQTINYQGYLKDAAGKPVSVSIPMVFSLYSSAGGQTPLWTEPQTVPVNNGIYTVTLGNAAPLDASAFSSRLHLGIKIGDDLSELQPRHRLTSVPYALQAGCTPGDGVECYSGPAATRNVTPCKTGKRVCAPNGSWGPCAEEQLPQPETSNGIDDDCDGVFDNNPCTLDADCSASQFCGDAQKCLTKLANGTACTREAQCTVHCTNGICSDLLGCDTPADCGAAPTCSSTTCNNHVCGTQFEPSGTLVAAQTIGDCRSNQCNGSGAIVSVANNSDLPASDGNACTQDLCSNGTPTYQYSAAGTTCNGSGVCNGIGSCVECLSGSDCPSGICSDSICKKSMGTACLADNECGTGFCTDGYCCEARCGGTCEACNQAGRVGLCDPAPAGTDPGNECAMQSASSCGTNGICSGSRACAFYSSGTIAVAESCSAETYTQPSTCNGSGGVVTGGSTPCIPYVCGSSSACKTSCAANVDCANGYMCSNGTCQASTQPDGTPCDDGNLCTANDVYQGGICTGVAKNCADEFACTTDACDPANGSCIHSPVDAICSDGNLCNGSETCSAQLGCVAGTPVSCDDANACTSDVCDAQFGCQHSAQPDDLPCGTGLTCQAGNCI